MNRFAVILRFALLAVLACLCVARAAEPSHKLSREVESVLLGAKSATLYSLDPLVPGEDTIDEKLEGFEVIGKVRLDASKTASAAGAFRSSVARWPRIVPACFYPRKALCIESGGRHYDFLLSAQCLQLYVYRDGVVIEKLGAGESESPEVLNPMLTDANIQLAWEDPPESPALWKPERARWLAAMPGPVLAVWKKRNAAAPDARNLYFEDVKPLRAALEKGIPDRSQRILALLGWYGSGRGPWSGFPSYEQAASDLLEDYSTPDIIAAVRGKRLTDAQIEGTARLLGDMRGPEDCKLIPPSLRKLLMDHTLKSKEEMNRDCALRAFHREWWEIVL